MRWVGTESHREEKGDENAHEIVRKKSLSLTQASCCHVSAPI